MNLKTAEQLLACHRNGVATGSRVEKAVKIAKADAALRAVLERQEKWDSQLVDVIHSIVPPEDFRKKLTSYGAPSPDSARSSASSTSLVFSP